MKKLLPLCLIILCLILTSCAANFHAECVRTYYTGGQNEHFAIVHSTEELHNFSQTEKDLFPLTEFSPAQKYDEAFFENHIVVIVILEDPSGSIRHKVTKASVTDKTLTLQIQDISPRVCTDDMAAWVVFVELDKEYENVSEVKIERVRKIVN